MTLTQEQFTALLEKLDFFLTLVGEIGCRGPQGQGMLEYIGGALKRDGEESLSAGLQSIAGAIDLIAHRHQDENRIQRAAMSATEKFKYNLSAASEGGFPSDSRDADETVHEFLGDWFVITDESSDWIPRRRVNKLYDLWCDHNELSPEDRVTTSVLRRSLTLLGVALVQGHTDSKRARTWVFTGIKTRDGVPAR